MREDVGYRNTPVSNKESQVPFYQHSVKTIIQVRGSAGEHSEAVGGKYDISNRERLGLTEYEVMRPRK